MTDGTPASQGAEPQDPRLVEAQILQAQAAARKAAVEAATAERTEAEAASAAVSPAVLRQQKDAEAKKAIAEADKAVSDARQAQVSSLIPDFSKVQVPAAKIDGDQTMRGNDLARHALRSAAAKAAAVIAGAAPKGNGTAALILVTSEVDLASADGAYVEVSAGLRRLTESADKQLPDEGQGFAVAAAAVASALPGLISMLAPRQTLSSRAIADDDTAAVAAIAGALVAKGCQVRIDDFRLVPTDGIVAQEQGLRERRDRLAKFKLEQEKIKSDSDSALKTAAQRLADLLKINDHPPTGGLPSGLDDNIAQARTACDAATHTSAMASVTADVVTALLTAIDAFFVAIHTPPAGAARSPMVSAALHEGLHTAVGGRKFDAVVYAKGSGGSVDQRIKEVFMLKDRIEATASVSVSYWMITPADSNVLASGVATGTARMSGKIGENLTISDVPSP